LRLRKQTRRRKLRASLRLKKGVKGVTHVESDALELSGGYSAAVRSPSPEETKESYDIRAGLEEIGGRSAACLLKGKKADLRKELEDAQNVQRAFFPQRTISIPCSPCEAFYQPASVIGGDYYDILFLDGHRWGIAIGDVCGKGIGAALIMASLRASLKCGVSQPHSNLSTLVGGVNRLVYESSPTNIFATLFYAEYEPGKRVLNYVNAGHNPPLVFRPKNGSCEIFRLPCAGIPVGIFADSQFGSATFQFEIDDVLLAYTDGITEVENPQREQWGEQSLVALLRSCSRKSPEEIINAILEQLTAFANGQPQRDDVTLLVMRVEAG
jgi:sigma-B regulation protein RsbU (phosphoserine phosphatase)